jgi:hypothetical protein
MGVMSIFHLNSPLKKVQWPLVRDNILELDSVQ